MKIFSIPFKDYYFKIKNNATHDVKYRKGLKILILKQILQRLSIALAQVKAGNTSKKLLNEIRQIIICIEQKKSLKKYITI